MGIQEMICQCLRCGHEWVKRIPGKPGNCPHCQSPYWDTPVGVLPRGRPPKKKAAKKAAR